VIAGKVQRLSSTSPTTTATTPGPRKPLHHASFRPTSHRLGAGRGPHPQDHRLRLDQREIRSPGAFSTVPPKALLRGDDLFNTNAWVSGDDCLLTP